MYLIPVNATASPTISMFWFFIAFLQILEIAFFSVLLSLVVFKYEKLYVIGTRAYI